MQTPITPEQRQATRREMIRQVEQGTTVSDARRLCPVPMHRTTVYRLLKRTQREGEQAFIEGRHGHPVKLRGEILTWVADYCQSHPSAPSAEVQHLLGSALWPLSERQSTEPGASCSWLESPVGATRKKSRKLAW